MTCNTNSGHITIHDTLPGPKGGLISRSPQYVWKSGPESVLEGLFPEGHVLGVVLKYHNT